jgi:hypothetical protein
MKWLLVILSLFMKPLTRFNPSQLNPAHEMKQFFMDNAKKVLLAITVTSVVSSLFVAGMVITIITMSAQYDQNAGIGLSAMLLGGIGMMALSLIVGWLVFSPSRETRELEREARDTSSTSEGNTLTDALTLLIHDFVKEREFRRHHVGESQIDRGSLRESLGERRSERRSERREGRREGRREERREARREENNMGPTEASPEESYFGYKDTDIRH